MSTESILTVHPAHSTREGCLYINMKFSKKEEFKDNANL